jgi:uncharacterized protein YecE (DUF72 family)
MKNLFLGTSGFTYKNWSKNFYPENIPQKKYLEYYSTQFNSVEINGTFYRTPTPKSVINWKDTVHKDFVFAIKGSRFISHVKRLTMEPDSIDIFFNPLEPLRKDKRHIILWQFPPTFKLNADRLDSFFDMLLPEFRYAFEFRHDSWFNDETYAILRRNNAALVLSDSPVEQGGKRKWPYEKVETADFYYVRFHGSEKLYASRYTDEELDDYAEFLGDKLKRGLSVYAYFDNDAEAHAPFDALRLKERLE